MPEVLTALAPAAIEGGTEAFASAAPEIASMGAESFGATAPGAFGIGEMAAQGLPFAPGVSDIGSLASASTGAFGSTAADIGSTLGNFGFGLSDSGALASAVPGAADFGAAASAFPGTGNLGADLTGASASLSGATGSSFPGATPFDSFANTGAPVASIGDVASTGPGVTGTATGVAPSAATAAPVTGAVAPTGASSLDLTSMLGKAVGNINPLSAALGAVGLGYNIMQGQKQSATTGAIQDQANKVSGQAAEISGQGKQLVSHLESGTLPPNIQAQLDAQTKDAKTKIVSNYASQGMNTDPNKNSSLRQELAAVDRQSKVLSGQMAQQLAASGTNLINAGTQLTGLDNNLLTTLSNVDQTQTQRMGQAISNFAAALNGNKGGINLKLAP